MDLLASSLKPEIDKVLAAPNGRVFSHWTATFHCRGEDVKALYVDDVTLIRNYAKAFSDQISVMLTIPEGDFSFMVYPSREILELTLRKSPLSASESFRESTNSEIVTKRYRAILMDTRSSAIEQNLPTTSNRETANRMSLIRIQVQLIDPLVDHVRKSVYGGTFRSCIGANALRAFLGSISAMSTDEIAQSIKGVDLADGYSEKVYDNCIVPDHTPMELVPRILDEECGGIYPTGMRYYLQRQHWYIYPIYDLRRYDRASRVMNVINVPRGRLTGVETTFRKTGNQIIILATGETIHFDPTEKRQLQEGNAVRYVDAVKMFDDAVKNNGNRAIADLSKTLSEITVEPRESGKDQARLADLPFTTRHYLEMSKLAERSGFYIQVAWENAAPDNLYPGMPAKYSYLNGSNQVEELHGILVGVQARDTPTSKDLVERRFNCTAAITMFLERKMRTRS